MRAPSYISTSGRTSTLPPMRAAGIRAAIFERRVDVVGFDRVEAAEDLFGLGEGPVGGERAAVLNAHCGGARHRRQLRAADHARRLEDGAVLAEDRLLLGLGEAVPAVGVIAVGVDEKHVLHDVNLRRFRGCRPYDERPRSKSTGGTGVRVELPRRDSGAVCPPSGGAAPFAGPGDDGAKRRRGADRSEAKPKRGGAACGPEDEAAPPHAEARGGGPGAHAVPGVEGPGGRGAGGNAPSGCRTEVCPTLLRSP